MSFIIDFKNIKDARNIIFLNNEGEILTADKFEEEIKTGYRAGMVIVPIENEVQVPVAIMTPYHKDQFHIDPGFLVHQFKNYCKRVGKEHWIPENEYEYFLGEIFYD